MFTPYKNSYLQLVCAVNPRVINKVVDLAMQKTPADMHTEIPAAQRLESMQPSLYAPHVDITKAYLGYGRVGLRLLNRELHSPDSLVQLQAVNTLVDQLQISENAMFLIHLHVVYRLVDLMLHQDAFVREKVCLALTLLAGYYEARRRINLCPKIIENLMWLTMRDNKELRYVAANALYVLTNDRCSVEGLLKCENIVENLLKMVKYEHTTIVSIHLKTLENLIEWDPVCPLKANAFQTMLELMKLSDPRIVSGAMNCMMQLCKHVVGRKLADVYDLTFVLRPYLKSCYIEVIISALGLMAYTTLTVRSKWRAKECCVGLTRQLVKLCLTHSPLVQLRAMQVLINLCDSPDIRNHVKKHWLKRVEEIQIRSAENWNGTSETTYLGLNTGRKYRTEFKAEVETIGNAVGDNVHAINVHSYVRHMHQVKAQLLKAINWKSYKD